MVEKKKIQTLHWQPYSADFNPIENLWDELERRVKKYQSKNITQLELLLIQEWNKIELPALDKTSRLFLVDCVNVLN